MEIQRRDEGDTVVLHLQGRLDSYWAGHLSQELEAIIRKGGDRITLDFSKIEFMSSAGISVLLRYYKMLKEMRGVFLVAHPTEVVKTVMDLSGLSRFLLLPSGPAPAPPEPPKPSSKSFATETGNFELFELDTGAALRCKPIGHGVSSDGPLPRSSVSVPFPAGSFGIGLGAFGESFQDCADRFGEFLAAAGASLYLPTDGKNVPDYLVAKGTFVPEMQVVYGMRWQGEFSHLLRFDVREEEQTLSLDDLLLTARESCGDRMLGFVMVAETTGLIGAALKRSPVSRPHIGSIFAFPSVREWLTYTAEPAHARCSALVIGLTAPAAAVGSAEGLLKPLSAGGEYAGHIHAAAFSFHQLRKGRIDLHETVGSLLESESMYGLLHLINDDRPLVGAGGSEFVRGALWFGPVGEGKTA